MLDAGGEGLQAQDAGAGVEEVPDVVKVVEGDQVGAQDALLNKWVGNQRKGLA